MAFSANCRAFRFGDWLVTPSSNSVHQGAERRQMEPRAMDVLQVLCRAPGTVVSAEELLSACWGSNEHGDNPVHKTIAQLRRVLDDSSQAPRYIETIRKRGYRAIAELEPDTEAANGTWLLEAPFRGLEPFDEQHSAIFFGRAGAIAALSEVVRGQVGAGLAFALVLGPSGSGKTSLVRAGLLPALSAPGAGMALSCSLYLDCADLGGADLACALGSVLLDAEADGGFLFGEESADTLGLRLRRNIDGVIAQLGARPPMPRIALFIDRFEAIFSLPQVVDAERTAFLGMLDRLARSGWLLVLVACRNDFYPQVATQPQLMALKAGGGHFDLDPPSAVEIGQIVRYPARAAALRFEAGADGKAPLDELLCEAARSGPDTLPLLQYCLHELYRQRGPDGELSYRVYEGLGGIEGAIGARAEQVLSALGAAQIGALPHVLSLLVKVGEDASSVTSRRAAWSSLQDQSSRELIRALVDARLFVSGLHGGTPTFGIAHEALLRRWPRVVAWIETHRDALQLRTRVGQQAARWHAGGRARDLLLPRGTQANQARSLLAQDGISLDALEREFIASSLRRVHLGERLRLAVLALIAGLALLAGIFGLTARQAQRSAERHRTEAESLMEYMLGEFVDKLRPLGRLDLLDSVSTRALGYLAANDLHDADPVELAQRAKALQVLSEVKIARADPAGARAALTLGQAILRRQLQASPLDKTVLKSAGANAFWLGQISFNQDNWTEARRHFTAYRELADRLAALAPADPDGMVEQSYAHNSLGSTALESGDVAVAADEFARSVELKTRALALDGGNKGLRADLANSLSWQASARARLGDLSGAMQLYQRELGILGALRAGDSSAALWTDRYAFALWHRGELDTALGWRQPALDDFRQAATLLREAVARDPGNRDLEAHLLTVELKAASLDAQQGGAREARAGLATLGRLEERLAVLSRLEPKKLNLARLVNLARVREAELYLRLRDRAQAGRTLAPARQALARLHGTAPADQAVVQTFADALLLQADIDGALGASASGDQPCRLARTLLAPSARGSNDFNVLAPWVQVHLCLGEGESVSMQSKQLENMKYKEARYLSYLSNHTHK